MNCISIKTEVTQTGFPNPSFFITNACHVTNKVTELCGLVTMVKKLCGCCLSVQKLQDLLVPFWSLVRVCYPPGQSVQTEKDMLFFRGGSSGFVEFKYNRKLLTRRN
jgi:hypothetical protein